MSAPKREQLSNAAISALNGSIDGSQTSIDVLDGSVFPAAGNFHIKIEDEILLCTARSSNTLTVVRAQEGTSGASHADEISVTEKVTTESLQIWGENNLPLWANTSRLPLNTLVADNGSTLLTSSDFTWVNQGTATVSDQLGTLLLRTPAVSAGEIKVRGFYRNAPSAPYSYIAALQMVGPNNSSDSVRAVFGFRKSSTGALTLITYSSIALSGSDKLAVLNYSDPTTFFNASRAEIFVYRNTPVIWLKVEDDNTNLKFYIGDGIEWILLATVGRTVFMSGGPDQLFWGGSNHANTGAEALTRLVHWSRNS